MDAAQRAQWAELGYLVVREAIPRGVLDELNALYDERLAGFSHAELVSGAAGRERGAYLGKERSPTRDRHGREYDGQRMWGAPYHYLIDNPSVEPLLAEMLGDPASHPQHCPELIAPEQRPLWRLDHDNIHFKLPCDANGAPDEGGGLHGVPEGFHVSAVYELYDVNVGDGGFGCLPGSHDFAYNERLEATLEPGWRTSWADSPWTSKLASWPADVPVHRVADEAGGLKAGDCILFSERMKHGTLPWTGAGERRTLFYKYVPYGFHHEDAGYDVRDPELTPRQQQLLEFPAEFCNTPEEQYAPYRGLEVHEAWSSRGKGEQCFTTALVDSNSSSTPAKL